MRSRAIAPSSSVISTPTRSSQHRGRSWDHAAPEAGAPGTRLSASKRTRTGAPRSSSSPARSATLWPGASVHSISESRVPSSVRARTTPPAGAVSRCTSSKTRGARPCSAASGRPVVTHGLAAGNRNEGCPATRSHAASGQSPVAQATCSSGAAPATSAMASRSGAVRRSGRHAVSAQPATAVTAMPCHRGAPSHAARSAASAMFAHSRSPTVISSVTTGKREARSSRGGAGAPSPARPPSAMSGASRSTSPSQSPSPACVASAAGTASSMVGVSQAARRRETAVIRRGAARAARPASEPPRARPPGARARRRTTRGETGRRAGSTRCGSGARRGGGTRRGAARAGRHRSSGESPAAL